MSEHAEFFNRVKNPKQTPKNVANGRKRNRKNLDKFHSN